MERKTLDAARTHMPPDAEFSMYSNKAQTFLDLAANVLDARMSAAHSDRARAIEYWKNEVQIQDGLYYGEPPEWFYPVRESLGSALIGFAAFVDEPQNVFAVHLVIRWALPSLCRATPSATSERFLGLIDSTSIPPPSSLLAFPFN